MRLWIQITSGRGPEECCWVVERLLDELSRDARQAGVDAKTLEVIPNEDGEGLRSVLVGLSGDGNLFFATQWRGTVLWRGTSPFRRHHKRKNWYVGVDVIRPAEKVALSLADVELSFSRASGPGGQHVNRTETAVRVRHGPTGLVARASEERSQHLNRELALARLNRLIEQAERAEEESKRAERWHKHNRLERGNPARIYEGASFKRVS